MGQKDTVTKEYMRDNEVFADLFNYALYKGVPVIDPNLLQEMDTTEIAIPFGDDGTNLPVQKYRDVLKAYIAKSDNNAVYLLLGVENQTDIHYAMPVRVLLYNAIQYAEQVEKIAKRNREQNNYKTRDEFLSGFRKKDKIVPVITLVMYWGEKEWDAPISLFDMMDIRCSENIDETILENFKIKVISPLTMTDEEILSLSSSLREVMFCIKHSNDKAELLKRVYADFRYRHLDTISATVIKNITNIKLPAKTREEGTNMCQAIEEMKKDERILATIDAYRDCHLSQEEIRGRIIAKYDISEKDADLYLSGKVPD